MTLLFVIAMVRIMTMTETLLAEIVEVMIAGVVETTIANVALPVAAAAQPHQDPLEEKTNGSVMKILAKTISKVLTSNIPAF